MSGKLYFLLFLCCLAGIPAYSIQAAEDTLSRKLNIPTRLKWIVEEDIEAGALKFELPDTSLNDLEKVNPAYRNHMNTLGSIGSAANDRIFRNNAPLLSKPGTPVYDLYVWSPQQTRYFRGNKRFSQIDFHSGTFKEQEIRLTHAQNILKNWNAGFDFHRLSVKDFTRNSDVFHSQFSLFSWYESPNKKYNLFVNGLLNTIRNQVNGGLSSDSLYESGSINNIGIKGLSTPLSNAENRLKDNFAYLRHFYLIYSDTSNSKLYLQQSSCLEKYSFTYTDQNADSAYYSNFYNGNNTYDSLGFISFTNRIGINFLSETFIPGKIILTANAGTQQTRFVQNQSRDWDNLFMESSLKWMSDSMSWKIHLNGQRVIAGEDKDNYRQIIEVSSPQKKIGYAALQLMQQQSSAGHIYRYYSGNHFRWSNDWNKLQIRSMALNYHQPKYHLSAGIQYFQLRNYLYLNEAALPEQHTRDEEIVRYTLSKRLHGKYFHFETQLILQQNSNEEVLRFPEFSSLSSIYFEGNLFKNAMQGRVGINLNYYSGYYAHAFMPASGFFHLQNIKKTGDYPIADFFISTKIKTANIFLVFENILDGIAGDHYYETPFYPEAGRTFKFGVRWRFFDN